MGDLSPSDTFLSIEDLWETQCVEQAIETENIKNRQKSVSSVREGTITRASKDVKP